VIAWTNLHIWSQSGLAHSGERVINTKMPYRSPFPSTNSLPPLSIPQLYVTILHITFKPHLITLLFLIINQNNKQPSTSPPITMPPKPKLNVQSFPRPPLLEKTPRHLQVKWRGHTIADTTDAYWVLETYHPPSISPFLSKEIQSALSFIQL
jgi:hypothetical protein